MFEGFCFTAFLVSICGNGKRAVRDHVGGKEKKKQQTKKATKSSEAESFKHINILHTTRFQRNARCSNS
jgi:hypothetical protein